VRSSTSKEIKFISDKIEERDLEITEKEENHHTLSLIALHIGQGGAICFHII